jgi:tetratricopeptide (TPR) repeat protein
VARGDQDRTEQRDQLRRDMLAKGASYAQIAAGMADTFQDRKRAAWRYAHGWSQKDVAALYNQEVNDANASMTPQRISDFERWPVNKTAAKPTLEKLGVLAKLYATKISSLLDHRDRQKMTNAELITIDVLDSGVIPQQLPATIPNFVGRVHELNLLTAQSHHVNRATTGTATVVISSIGGTAGIGKTTLALHWARTHIDHFPDGQLYIDLRGFSPGGAPVTPQEAIRGFLDAFQIPPERIPITLDAQVALYRYLHTSFAANRLLAPHRKSITLEAPQPGVIPGQITDYEQAMNWFTVERAVLLSATNYAVAQGLDTHAWQLPWTLATFLNGRGHWNDYEVTQQIALATAERLGDQAAQAVALRLLGQAQMRFGRYADALIHLQQALSLFQELDDCDGQARTHMCLCWAYGQQGQNSQARTNAQHALDLYRTTGNCIWQARALNSFGWFEAQLGNHQQTVIYCQQALNLHHEVDDRGGEAATLDSLGYAHYHLGHHDQAITYCQHALVLRQELGDRYGEAETLNHLGDIHHVTSNIPAARDVWRQALTIFDQLGHSDAETVRAKLATLDANSGESSIDDQL